MGKRFCHPPTAFCCQEFEDAFFDHEKHYATERGDRIFEQDPATGLIKNEEGKTVHFCRFCEARIDPIVRCGWTECKETMILSESFVDNNRYLCHIHGPEIVAKRQRAKASVRERPR